MCFTTLHNLKMYVEAPSKAMTRKTSYMATSEPRAAWTDGNTAAQSASPDAHSWSSKNALHIPAFGGSGMIRQKYHLTLTEQVCEYT